MAIVSFGNQETEDFFYDGTVGKGCGWMQVQTVAARKLDMLDAASSLLDLRSPPNNRLEALKGDLRGIFSIRINEQWRIIFRWTDMGPEEVEIVDYHS